MIEGAFLEQGKEFLYDVEVRVAAGTMDYDPHLAGGAFRFTMRLQSTTPSQINGEVRRIPYKLYSKRRI